VVVKSNGKCGENLSISAKTEVISSTFSLPGEDGDLFGPSVKIIVDSETSFDLEEDGTDIFLPSSTSSLRFYCEQCISVVQSPVPTTKSPTPAPSQSTNSAATPNPHIDMSTLFTTVVVAALITLALIVGPVGGVRAGGAVVFLLFVSGISAAISMASTKTGGEDLHERQLQEEGQCQIQVEITYQGCETQGLIMKAPTVQLRNVRVKTLESNYTTCKCHDEFQFMITMIHRDNPGKIREPTMM